MHLYSHIFHSIYFNGTKRHDETEKNRYSVGAQHFVLLCVFLPFLKSASISMERRRKKSTPNRIVISSNGRLYVQRGESESYKTQWSVIKLFIFIFSFSFLLFSFFCWSLVVLLHSLFLLFSTKKAHLMRVQVWFDSSILWCVCVLFSFFWKHSNSTKHQRSIYVDVWFATKRQRSLRCMLSL